MCTPLFISFDTTKAHNLIHTYVRWRWNYQTSWLDERLKWPTECQIKGKANDFLKTEILNYLWNAADFMSDVGGDTKDLVCQKTFQITQVKIFFICANNSFSVKYSLNLLAATLSLTYSSTFTMLIKGHLNFYVSGKVL